VVIRVCTKCGMEKPLSEEFFRLDKGWYRRECIECKKEMGRNQKRRMYKTKREELNLRSRTYHFNIKSMVINHYGGHCAVCGETNLKFLAIDHVHGDGSSQRRINKGQKHLPEWIFTNKFPDGFQVLCHNHNFLKRLRHNELNHLNTRQARGSRNWNKRLKRTVISYYGGVCECCGEDNIDLLTIDHINGNGAKHRRSIPTNTNGSAFYRWLRNSNYPGGFRVLCFNCNCGRHTNGGICPHKGEES